MIVHARYLDIDHSSSLQHLKLNDGIKWYISFIQNFSFSMSHWSTSVLLEPMKRICLTFHETHYRPQTISTKSTNSFFFDVRQSWRPMYMSILRIWIDDLRWICQEVFQSWSRSDWLVSTLRNVEFCIFIMCVWRILSYTSPGVL